MLIKVSYDVSDDAIIALFLGARRATGPRDWVQSICIAGRKPEDFPEDIFGFVTGPKKYDGHIKIEYTGPGNTKAVTMLGHSDIKSALQKLALEAPAVFATIVNFKTASSRQMKNAGEFFLQVALNGKIMWGN